VTKPLFLYATGTAFATEILGVSLGAIGGVSSTLTIGGRKFWNQYIFQDPFPWALDEQIWDARKVDYPAAAFPMNASINTGVSMTIAHINTVPLGTPFALGGYSQGAAVMSLVYREIVSGSLTSRAGDFMGGVMFGNPMRQQDFTAPGVTWSGAWDVPGSTTGGSGCFPDRLSGCEYGVWREYVNVDEIIAATGTSTLGAGWRAAVGWLTGMLDPWTTLTGLMTTDWINGANAALAVGDFGHVRYPIAPPLSTTGQTYTDAELTSYELALDFLDTVVHEQATVPVVLPTDHPSLNKQWTTFRPVPAS